MSIKPNSTATCFAYLEKTDMFLGPSGKRYPTTGTSSSTLESPPYSPSHPRDQPQPHPLIPLAPKVHIICLLNIMLLSMIVSIVILWHKCWINHLQLDHMWSLYTCRVPTSSAMGLLSSVPSYSYLSYLFCHVTSYVHQSYTAPLPKHICAKTKANKAK